MYTIFILYAFKTRLLCTKIIIYANLKGPLHTTDDLITPSFTPLTYVYETMVLYHPLLKVNLQTTILHVICSPFGHFGGQLSQTASRRIRAIELVHIFEQSKEHLGVSGPISCPSILLTFFHDSKHTWADQVKAQVNSCLEHQKSCLRTSSATNGHGKLGSSVFPDFSSGLTLFLCFEHLEPSKGNYSPLIQYNL